MPNFIIIENVKTKKEKQTILRRDMKSFDPVTYQAQLRHSILLEIDEIDHIEEAYNFFHIKQLAILNALAPIRFLTKKEQELERKPWITKGILKSTRVINNLLKIKKMILTINLSSTEILSILLSERAKNNFTKVTLLKILIT